LISLGLDKPTLEPKATRIKKTPATKKRKLPETSADNDGGNKPPAKVQRVESGVRRSSRNVGKTVDYQSEVVKGSPVPISFSSGVKTSENSGPLGRQTGRREYDPLAFLFFFHQHIHY
jgi:E3 ubiquitin-protein ligase UHRF1